MGTFTIDAPNGKSYTIEGDNAQGALAALKQHLGESAAPARDKYQQAAIDDRDRLAAKGIESPAGLTERLFHGATMGAGDEIIAGLSTPLQMIKQHTLDPTEGYAFAKAREDLRQEDARKNTGWLGTAAEVLGGAISGGGLAKAGITAGRFLAPNAGFLARLGAGAADSAALGGVSGAMEGNGLADRAKNAAGGALGGAVLGAGLPLAGKLIGAMGAPIFANVKARMNPEGYAQGQIARAIHESGVSPDDLSLSAIQAGNEGQPQFNLADAMGNAGQRMLRAAAGAPGEGRTAIVNALEGRQAGQGRRVASTLAEGFDAPRTAAQTEAAMTAARGTTADAEYGAVRNNAAGAQVDVVPAINNIDRTIGTIGGQNLQTPNDSIEGALRPFRERLARVDPNDFAAVDRIRGDMADAAQSARQGGNGNRARLIGQAVRELDASMEAASPGYRQANANYRQRSQDIAAIGEGRQAATRGRTEDTIPAFQAQTPAGQQAFRTGYVDPLIEQAQSAALGANKARPLTNDAFQAESAAMAPGNPMMQRRIGREMTMFETRNAALGGSKTDMNLADADAMGVDPHLMGLVGNIAAGNYHGAVHSALSAGKNHLTGNTAEVRGEVAKILLRNGANLSAQELRDMVNKTVARIQFVQSIARNVGRGVTGGLAVAAPGLTSQQPQRVPITLP